MSKELIEEIIAKASQLPAELQREALAFVESLAARREQTEIRSIKGSLSCNLDALEEDLTQARREMWKDFPREEPK